MHTSNKARPIDIFEVQKYLFKFDNGSLVLDTFLFQFNMFFSQSSVRRYFIFKGAI